MQSNPHARLESAAVYRLSMDSKFNMVNGMGIRETAGKRGLALLVLGLGVLLSGCMQQTIEPASDANLTPRDRKLLANPPYAKATIPEPYQRHIVDFHRKEAPGTIVVDPDARYLYYVLDKGKAIRYGVTVGEEALVFSGVAKVGRREEWPSWTPTADIKKRLGNIPDFVGPGPHNPLGARGLYLFSGNRDTLYRIHGTNQPEYIGSAISSGCIRMTNEDVIDLYNRVKLGTPVVVLALGQSDSPFNPRMALGSERENELIRSSIAVRAAPDATSGAVFICERSTD